MRRQSLFRHSLFLPVAILLACAPVEREAVSFSGEWTVMGTSLNVTVYAKESQADKANADIAAAYEIVAEVDRHMSLYQPDSELVALNARAGAGAVSVSASLYEVLEAADYYNVLSRGALDVTVQPLIALWGFYDVDNATVPPAGEIVPLLQKVGRHRLQLDRGARAAALAPGSSIDLGAIAKGYAVDRAIDVLRARSVSAALVNLGGTIAVLGAAPGGRPWTIGIKHPREERLMGELRLREGAVATSGDYDRYFVADGKRFSHIIDPRTGWPVEGVFALTVIAPNATAADALSTAAFVLGHDEGMALLTDCRDVDGLMVWPEGTRQDNASDSAGVSYTLSVTIDTATAPSIDQTRPSVRLDSDIEVASGPSQSNPMRDDGPGSRSCTG